MPLSVESALKELPVLSSAQVVAGHKGLKRTIRWAHVVDIPDVVSWVREGDLLLTTAFALKDHPDVQIELIPRLVDKELSGMIVAAGPYFQEVPSEMIDLANKLDFPIIIIPWEVPFVEITRAIHEKILSEQYELIEQSLHIHKVLTQLVLEGKGLNDLAYSLAQLIQRSITIEDPSLRLLAYASAGPIDESRERSISEGQTPPEIVNRLKSSELFEQLQKDPKPQRVPPIPDVGLSLERIIAPIMVGEDIYGYVWIIATETPLTSLDFLAIERAATVAALMLSRERAIYEAEQRLKSNLLNNLLNPDASTGMQDLSESLRRLNLHRGYLILALDVDDAHMIEIAQLSKYIENKIEKHGLRATVIEKGGRLIVLLGSSDEVKGAEIAQELLYEATQKGHHLRIGISTPGDQATQVPQRFQEAIESLTIGKALNEGSPGIWFFNKLGILHWLHTLPPDIRAANPYVKIVREIADYDQNHDTQLLKTLEIYLENFRNAQQAANSLFIHRNTLRQRLVKIEENWGINLEDATVSLNMLLTIKDWRLNNPTT